MQLSPTAIAIPPLTHLKVWVLAPQLESEDPNLQYYYDFSQSIQEYTRVFEELHIDWTWQPVTISNYREVIGDIRGRSGTKIPLVINLCDGDEINGTPGVSIIHELEKHNLVYSGSDASFYEITTSKIPMKEAFDKCGIPTARWEVMNGHEVSVKNIGKRVGTPLILKPAVSGGSMGVSIKNVVHSEKDLWKRVEELRKGYRGWNLLADGLFAEQFIAGPEFTSLIVGSSRRPEACIVYPPVERVFHPSLPETEKFLSFDRLWEIYEDESPMPEDESFYEYRLPEDPALCKAIQQLSLDAYLALGGTGYGRLDIRMDSKTGNLYLLEVNAQCGLSEDEDYTSIGAILRYANKTFTQLITEIIFDAFSRRHDQ